MGEETVLERIWADLDTFLSTHHVAGIETPTLWPTGSVDAESEDIREGCRYDSKRFITTFFPEMCTAPFTAMHEAFFERADWIAREHVRGVRDVTAAPRGSAKTSTKGKGLLIWEGLYGYEQYILICSATRDMARDKTKDIRDVFESNQRLREVYGPQETSQWRQADFQIQVGCMYRAFTPRTAIRGILRNNKRPSKIVPDDAEDRETVLTPLRRQRFVDWWNADVMKLGDKETNIDAVGTVLHPESLLATLLTNPGYYAQTYQSVIHFADTTEAWQQWSHWRELILDLENPQRLEEARQYFTQHEATMMQHVEVLWPERKSYYDLMLSRLTESETAFWSEEQNAPSQDESYLFDLATLATFDVTPEGIARDDGRMIRYADMDYFCGFYDPTPGTGKLTADWAACPIVAQDRHGYQYCVDAYLSQLDSQDEQLNQIVAICTKWQVPKLGVESNSYQANLVDALYQKFADQGSDYAPMIIPVKHSGARNNKTVRIRTLQAPLHNQWLQLRKTLHSHVWEELREFTVLTTQNADDFLDALAAARTMILTGA